MISHKLSCAPMLDSADSFDLDLYICAVLLCWFLFGDDFGDGMGF